MAIRDVNVRILTTASAGEVTRLTEQINALKESLQGLTRSQEGGGSSAFSNELKSVDQLTTAFKEMTTAVKEGMREQQESVRAGYAEMTAQARAYVEESIAINRDAEVTKREEARATADVLIAEQQRIQEENTTSIMAAAAVQISENASKNEKLVEQAQIRADKEVEIERQKNALILSEMMMNAGIMTELIRSQTTADTNASKERIAAANNASRESIAAMRTTVSQEEEMSRAWSAAYAEDRRRDAEADRVRWQQGAEWAAEINAQEAESAKNAAAITTLVWQQAAQAHKAAMAEEAQYAKDQANAIAENNRRTAADQRESDQLQAAAAREAAQQVAQAEQEAANQARAFGEAVGAAARTSQELFASLGNTIREAIQGSLMLASEAISRFGENAYAVFSGLSERVSTAGSLFGVFGSEVEGSMSRAERSMQSFYASGWTLIMLGQQISMAGRQMFSGLEQNINKYLSYEQNVTQASIASTDLSNINPATGQPFNNSMVIMNGIADMQSKGVEINGKLLPVWTQTADQLAKGVYILASATGEQIKTSQDMRVVSERLVPMLQAAAITQTSPEEAIKGFLAAEMQFGINPIDAGQSPQVRDATTALMNQVVAGMMTIVQKTPLEMSDVIQSMKMVGPLAHYFSGGTSTTDIMDMLSLIGMIGEEGLRGGRVGSGLGMVIHSETNPTPKMQDALAAAFGEAGASTFVDPTTGKFKNGLFSMIEPMMKLYEDSINKASSTASDSQQKLNGIINSFTQNGQRDVIAALQAIETAGGMTAVKQLSAELQGADPMRMLSENILQQHDTIFGNLDNLRNAWFQLNAAIIQSIQGPLKAALKMFADAVWDIRKVIIDNPWIGEVVAGFGAIASALLVVIGSMMTFTGATILIAGALSKMGGAMQGVETLLNLIPALLTGAFPLMLVMVTAGIGAWAAWQADLGGVQEKVANFGNTLHNTIIPALIQVGDLALHTAMAFEEFMSSIMFGVGGTTNLQAFLVQVFGPEMAGMIMAQLDRLSVFMDGIRAKIADFFGNIPRYVGEAASALREFAGGVIQGLEAAFVTLIAVGMRVRDMLTAAFAALPTYITYFTDLVERITGFTFSLNSVGQAVGLAFGVFLSGHLLSVLSPIVSIIDQMAAKVLVLALNFGAFLFALSPVLGILALVTAGLIGYVAITDGVSAAMQKLRDVFDGVMLVVQTIIPLVEIAAGAFLALLQAATGSDSIFFNLGVAIGVVAAALAGEFVASLFEGVTGLGLFVVAAGADAVMALFDLTAALISAAGEFIAFAVTAVAGAAAGLASFSLQAAASLATFTIWIGVIAALALAIAGLGDILSGLNLTDIFNGIQKGFEDFLVRLQSPDAWDQLGEYLKMRATQAMQLMVQGFYQGIADFLGNYQKFWASLGVAGKIVEYAMPGLNVGSAAIYGGTKAAQAMADHIGSVISNENAALDAQTNMDKIYNNDGQMFNRIVDSAAFKNTIATGNAQQVNLLIQQLSDLWSKYNAAVAGGATDATPGFSGFSAALQQGNVGAAQSYLSGVRDDTVALNVAIQKGMQQAKDTASSGTSSWIDTVEAQIKTHDWGGLKNSVSSALGINIDDATKIAGDLISGKTSIGDLANKYTYSLSDSLGKSTESAQVQTMVQDAMTKYFNMVADYGVEATNAAYAANGEEIPTTPGFVDKIRAQVQAMNEVQQEWDKASSDLQKTISGLDLPTIMSGLTERTAPGQTSLGMFFANQQSSLDQFLSNYHYASGSGTNTEDLISHALTSFIGKDLGGQDVANVIANDPGIQHWAAEAGIAIPDLVAQVIKNNAGSHFMFDPKLMPAATLDLNAFFENMKITGKDHVIQTLNDVFDINWDELMHYSASQGTNKWNLADFFAEQWGMDKAKVEEILKNNGIDPNVYGSALTPDIADQINSGFGQYNVLTKDNFDKLQSLIAGATNKTISMTQDEWTNLPAAIKMALTSQGYTVVLDTINSIHQAWQDAWGKPITPPDFQYPTFTPTNGGGMGIDTNAPYAGLPDFNNPSGYGSGTSFPVDASGKPIKFKDSMTFSEIYNRDTQGGTIVTQDTTAAAYADWYEQVARDTERARKASEKAAEEAAKIKPPSNLPWWQAGGGAGAGPGGAGTNPNQPNLPNPNNIVPADTSWGDAWSHPGYTSVVGAGAADGPVTTATKSDYQGAAEATSSGIRAMIDITTQEAPKIAAAFATAIDPSKGGGLATGFGRPLVAAGPLDSIFKGWADSGLTAFKNSMNGPNGLQAQIRLVIAQLGAGNQPSMDGGRVQTATGPFDSVFKGYADAAVKAFNQELTTAFPGSVSKTISTMYGGGGGAATVPGAGAKAGSGPFDGVFQGYATSASHAFSLALSTGLQTAMTQAIASVSGQAAAGVATGAGIPMPGAGSGGPLDAHFTSIAKSAVTAFMGTLTGSSGQGLGMSDQVGEMLTGIPPSGAGDTLDTHFTTLAQNAVRAFETELQTINVAVDNVMSGLDSAIEAYDSIAWNAGFNVGYNVGAGMVVGINSQIGAVQAAAAALASAATTGAKNNLVVLSPSRVFMEIGRNVGQGFAIGMTDSHQIVRAAATSMSNAAVSGTTTTRPAPFTTIPRGHENPFGGSGVTVRIDNLTITKEADVDKVFARVETLMGQKMELVARGQTSFEIGNFGSVL